MSGVDIRILRRVLRQMQEAGCGEVLLESLNADDALRLVRAAAAGGTAGTGVARAQPARSGAAAVREMLLGGSGADRAGTGHAASREDEPGATGSTVTAGRGTLPRRSGALGEGAGALDVLARECTGCRACRLHETRRNVVFGEGPATADVVVVGEAPGQEEDRTGRPFVGRAGKLLDLLLLTAGFARESVYICNVLKCRPPQNRNPLPDEVTQCTTTFLHPQLDAIAPRVMIAVGKFAAQALLQSEESIGRLRGRVHAYRGTPLIVTYHPAFLLRSPQMNRVAWHDFQLLRQVCDEQG